MSKLSVIVPVYNVSNLVGRCLESLINQSFTDIEIILINDGSSDDTYQYIIPYLKDKRVIYIENHKNEGLGKARNIGIECAKGEYITFVDSDDWVDIDLYKSLMNSLCNNPADIALCGIKNEMNNVISSSNRYIYNYSNQISNKKALSLLARTENNNYFISPVVWNKIYRRQLLSGNRIKFLDNSYWEDNIFSFQMFLCANSVNIVPNIYYHYYQREKSITNDFSKKHIDDLIYSFKYLKDYLDSDNYATDIKGYFNAYLDRAIISLIEMLFKNEVSTKKQKKYLVYLYNTFTNFFSVSEAISYMDIDRIKRVFI